MSQKDILVFMSDQHNPLISSFSGGPARMPNLERLIQDGTSFSAAYTACPLCVPARVSMLTGRLPSVTGVFVDGAIAESTATFLHSLVAAGYETVLIGRMHFCGSNQRAGFTKRLVGDMTPVTWNYPRDQVAERNGELNGCFSEPGALNVIGGGNSPVLEFDRQVVQSALDYLSLNHEKPQCIFVSTYGPHFPYVAPVDLYLQYKQIVDIPDSYSNKPDFLNPLVSRRMMDLDDQKVLNARAAYCAMVETIDGQVGQIRQAFDHYLMRNEREGVFAYLSDHGDQAGEHRLFGKMTFFEASARIPLIFAGAGVRPGQVITEPVSLVDLGPTLCDLAGTVPPPRQDGCSLMASLTSGHSLPADRPVISELMDDMIGNQAIVFGPQKPVPARMIRQGDYKLITYAGYEDQDLLFNVIEDPQEMNNLAAQLPNLLAHLRQIARHNWQPEQLVEEHLVNHENILLVRQWELAVGLDSREFWRNLPPEAKKKPIVV